MAGCVVDFCQTIAIDLISCPALAAFPLTGHSLAALNQLSCNPHSTTSPKVSPTAAAVDHHHRLYHPQDQQLLHSQQQSSPQHHSKHDSGNRDRNRSLLTSDGDSGRSRISRTDANNNVDDDRVLDEENEDDEDTENCGRGDDQDDNGSDNNISVTSSPATTGAGAEEVGGGGQHGPETSLMDEDNEATNIITNTMGHNHSNGDSSPPPGSENGLLGRKSQLPGNNRSPSPPTTAGAFTSLIQRNSDTSLKHAATTNHYLKTTDLLSGFSGCSSGPSVAGHSGSFNPALAAQLFLQTSQPLLPPPSQWLYTQLYGANYGDFSWFRNSLSGNAAASAFRSISTASLSPDLQNTDAGDRKARNSHTQLGSDGERSEDRTSPPVTSTSKRSPSPSVDDGNGTEEESDIRQPMAKKLNTIGAFTRATTAEKHTTDVWRPY